MERRLRALLPAHGFGAVPPAISKLMASVRGAGNRTTERRARAILARSGTGGWTANARQVGGKPDLYFPAERLAIFLDGCYWHGCRSCGYVPKTNSAFWRAKLARNRRWDVATTRTLRSSGLSVLRVWEHELRAPGRFLWCVSAALAAQPRQSRQ
jgi:DNA mismatch endonuclease, patch repair protein